MKKTLLIALIVFASACQKEVSDIGQKGKDMSVEATIKVMGELQNIQWEDEDMIGVSVEGMADYYTETNIAFAYNSGTASFDAVNSGIILKGAQRSLTAYYPFVGPENEVPGEYVVLTTSEWQTPEGMQRNDYLFARDTVKREHPVAEFDFQHVMGLMKLEFEEASGKTGDISYTISGLIHKGSFNPYTGEVNLLTVKSEEISLNASDMTGTLMLLPQDVEAVISLTFEGKTYATTFPVSISSNQTHVYTVHISPENLDAALSVTDSGTADWIVGDGGSIESEDNLEVRVSDAATRAYTDDRFRTVFVDGDKIGVFAVRNGAVLPNVDNRMLIFDGKEWKFDSKVNYNSSMNGAVFYAYYPYAENITLDLSAADPFNNMVSGWELPYDQSELSVYNKCDVMTSSDEAEEIDGKFYLDFKMIHRMGLLSVTLPQTAYEFTNAAPQIEKYVLNSFSDVEFLAEIGSEPFTEVRPFFDDASQSYRLIVCPNTSVNVKTYFNKDGKPKKFTLDLPDGIAAGVCEPYKVDGGYKKTVMELKIGDYYCSDGTLASYEPNTPAPENAVGVVYMLGIPDVLAAEVPSCVHGLVYSLARTERPTEIKVESKYGDDPYVSYFASERANDEWYAEVGLDKDDHKDTDMNGYGYTGSWLRYEGDMKRQDIFKASILAKRASDPLPEGLATDWYLMSFNEFAALAENQSILDSSLQHASGEAVFAGTLVGAKKNEFRAYWTSTMRRGDAVCMYYSLHGEDKNNPDNPQVGYTNGRFGYFRYGFAF